MLIIGKSRKRRLFVVLLTIMALLASGVYTFAASSNVSIKSYKAPSSIKAGKSYSVKGTLSSNTKIKRVEIGIVDSSGGWTKYKYDNKKVNAKTFNVKKADSKLKFGKLSTGTYYYRIYAHTSDGVCHTVLNKPFTVTATSKSNGASLKSMKYPGTLTQGKGFAVKGMVKSSKKIKSVTIGVTDANGKWTGVKYTKTKINSKSYNLSKLDSKIKFGALPAGSYNYRIDVSTTKGTSTLANYAFTVKAKTAPAAAPAVSGGGSITALPSTGNKEVVTMVDDKSFADAKVDDVVTLKGCKVPVSYKCGNSFTPSGTVVSSEPIDRIEMGVVFTATNKWTEFKYDKYSVNSDTFDLSNAASTLKFNLLAGGEYKYRIYVHTASGVHIAMNHPFKVISSSKAQDAVNWAIQIASDDSFTYGKKPETSKVGCYFCGTNQKRKPKGYEKTYVCMTFVHAAYAHGAGDPEMLKDCQKGSHCVSLTDTNFTRYTCWEKIGNCKDLTISDLKPGDVLVKWSSNNDNTGHMCMYVGGDNLVEATGRGWSADSIAVRGGAAARLRSLGSNSKNYVMRYRK